MKKETHPETQIATVTCACGATHDIISTKKDIEVEICSDCHPFYTGTEKVLDTAGRVDKFRQRQQSKAKN